MITFTKADLVVRFPEFASEDEARVDALREMSRDYVDEVALGTKALTGLMLYTAHLLTATSASRAGTTGPVSSESVGSLSRSYGSVSSTGLGDLAATTYGLQYQRLVKNEFLGAGPFVQAAFADPDGRDGQPA